MITIEEPAQNVIYKEDVSTTSSGTKIIAAPCVIYKILITLDTSGDAIVSFSDDSDKYTSTDRVAKIAISGPATIPVTFPKGLPITSGLYATSNLPSVDITVVYD